MNDLQFYDARHVPDAVDVCPVCWAALTWFQCWRDDDGSLGWLASVPEHDATCPAFDPREECPL